MDEQEQKRQHARQSLERYMHYWQRWAENDSSRKKVHSCGIPVTVSSVIDNISGAGLGWAGGEEYRSACLAWGCGWPPGRQPLAPYAFLAECAAAGGG